MRSFYTRLMVLPVLFILAATNLTIRAQNLVPLTIQVYDTAESKGYYFFVPYKFDPPYTYDHALTIIDNVGNLVYYRVFGTGGITSTVDDFMIQSNGMMSYFSPLDFRYELMDSTFTNVDFLEAANGYEADLHEMRILPNGHYLLLAVETQTMDLSAYVWFGPNHNLHGSSTASVKGSVIQEFDENKNLVFQWRAFEHFDFADVDSVWLNSRSTVDWTHSNALEMDYDGNILLSSRHFDEITKISRQNGEIIWRLGGKNNDFEFLNDTIGFTGQHDIRRIDQTHITLWDNGQYTDPPVARALEYEMDEEAKTVNLVWEFINDSSMYSAAMGNFQMLPNGNRLIDFGFSEPAEFQMFTVVKPDCTRVIDVWVPGNYASYRAFNYQELPWELHRPDVYCEENNGSYYLVAEEGHAEYRWSDGSTTQAMLITETGAFQVFVPYGTEGYIGSEVFYVDDITDPCHGNPLQHQTLVLAAGWTGISSRLVPLDAGIQTLTSDISDALEILCDGNVFYQPGNMQSTLTDWDSQSGYFIKLNESAYLTVDGYSPENATVELSEGWNLIPVLSEELVEVQTLFAGNMDKMVMVKEAVGYKVFWPAKNIATLQKLQPGGAYLVKATEGFTITF